jgi:hypothetical protein
MGILLLLIGISTSGRFPLSLKVASLVPSSSSRTCIKRLAVVVFIKVALGTKIGLTKRGYAPVT